MNMHKYTKFPNTMTRKKARAWLDAHPETNVYDFWIDQADKHDAASSRWNIVALVSLLVVIAYNVVLVLITLDSLDLP
jgi:hypothetical protein